MYYKSKIKEVKAIQLEQDLFYDDGDEYTSCRHKVASEGDWFVIEEERQYFLNDIGFKQSFDEA